MRTMLHRCILLLFLLIVFQWRDGASHHHSKLEMTDTSLSAFSGLVESPYSPTDSRNRTSVIASKLETQIPFSNSEQLTRFDVAKGPRPNHPKKDDSVSKLPVFKENNNTFVTRARLNRIRKMSFPNLISIGEPRRLPAKRDAQVMRFKRSSVDACPVEWANPRDRFAQPRGIKRLQCSDSAGQRLQNLFWGYNPKFGLNWNRPVNKFNFTQSWNASSPSPLYPGQPFVDSLGNLVIRLDSYPDSDRSWSGEFLCLYTCSEDGVDEALLGSSSSSSSFSSSSSSSSSFTRWKRRILWLKVYERDPVAAAASLRTLFLCVGLLAALVIAAAVAQNAEEMKFAIWRCLRADRGPFSYIV